MTKTIIAPLRTHLDQEVTALCTCWEITRRDGKVIRLTDNDEPVVINAQIFGAVGAYKRSAIERLGGQDFL